MGVAQSERPPVASHSVLTCDAVPRIRPIFLFHRADADSWGRPPISGCNSKDSFRYPRFSCNFPGAMSAVTLILQAAKRGEKQPSEELLPLVYDELRRIAGARMVREAAEHTLQPTALVHEAWVRLVQNGSQSWDNRAHFLCSASEAMRRILIERARRKARLKHGGAQIRINIEDVDVAETLPDDKLLLLDEALEQLKAESPDVAQVVLLKFYGGLSNEKIIEITGTSDRTVRRQWIYAKVWLFNRISGQR